MFKTIAMIHKVYDDESMSDTQIKEWFRQFKSGRTSIKSDSRSGRPQLQKLLKMWNEFEF